MKRFLILICILILSISCITAEEMESRFQESELWSLEYLNRYVDNSFSNIAKVYYKENGEVAFCIDPEVMMKPNADYNIEFSSDLPVNIARIIKAYKESNRSDDLYIAAQLLIWNELGIYKTVESKNAYDFGAYELIDKMNQLSHNYRPAFTLEKSYNLNETIHLSDNNGVLSKGYYIDSYSNGLDIKGINGNEIEFTIESIYPVNKEIIIKPESHLNNILSEQFTVYLASGSQSLVSYKGIINDTYEGTKISFKHKTGNLTIRKLDEYYTLADDATLFRIYAVNDDNEIIEEILKEDGSYFQTENGILEINNILPVGRYLVEEYETSYKYINRKDSFIVDLIEDNTVTVDFINENRTLKYELYKQDKDNKYYINDTKFSLYDISDSLDLSIEDIIFGSREQLIKENCPNEKGSDFYQSEDLYIIKRDIRQNLVSAFNLNDNQYIVDSNNNLYHDDCIFTENGFIEFDLLEKSDLAIIPEITYFKGDILSDKPKEKIVLYGSDNKSLEAVLDNKPFESEDNCKLRYSFIYDDEKYYIFLNGYLNDNDEIDNEYEIYKCINTFNTYIINNDNMITDSDFRIFKGLKIANLITGQSNLQIVNPDKHYYPIKNSEITLYEDEQLNNEIGVYTTNNLGYLNTEIKNDTVYYEVNNKIIKANNTKADGFITYPYLKQNRKYLLCEDRPNNKYSYGDTNSCHLVDTYDVSENEIIISDVLTNDVKKIDIELYKTNQRKNIRLDGAQFEIYLKEDVVNNIRTENSIDPETSEIYIGKYESGALNINCNDFICDDKNYQIEIYNDSELEELIKIIPYKNDDLILNNFREGQYHIVFRNIDDNSIVKVIEKDVSKGKIYIDNIPMNYSVIIREIKAPRSYYFVDNTETITLNDYEILHKLPYNRINHLIIINTACYE